MVLVGVLVKDMELLVPRTDRWLGKDQRRWTKHVFVDARRHQVVQVP